MSESGVSFSLQRLSKKLTVALCAVPLWAGLALGQSSPAVDLTKAENLFKHTDFAESLALLDRRSSDGPTNFLIGRDFLMMGEFKKSVEFLQKATEVEPKN